jgi:hypothetical protein
VVNKESQSPLYVRSSTPGSQAYHFVVGNAMCVGTVCNAKLERRLKGTARHDVKQGKGVWGGRERAGLWHCDRYNSPLSRKGEKKSRQTEGQDEEG